MQKSHTGIRARALMRCKTVTRPIWFLDKGHRDEMRNIMQMTTKIFEHLLQRLDFFFFLFLRRYAVKKKSQKEKNTFVRMLCSPLSSTRDINKRQLPLEMPLGFLYGSKKKRDFQFCFQIKTRGCKIFEEINKIIGIALFLLD